MAYCAPSDLLLGGIPVPTGLSSAKFVSDAADEIDSYIGLLYETPVDIVNDQDVVRPVKLLLKRLNVYLASGRLILAATANGEDDRLHAYGLSLIQEAQKGLYEIAEGNILLTGATPTGDSATKVSTPLINNLDAESNVEAFYNRLANPNYRFSGPYSHEGDVIL